MERRKPLKRGKPLERRTALKPGKGLKPSKRRLPDKSEKKLAAAAAEAAVRAEVFARDRHCRLRDVDGAGRCFGRLTFQHRRKAGQGGKYTVANGAALCEHHNSHIEADADLAALARRHGLVLLRTDPDDGGLPAP